MFKGLTQTVKQQEYFNLYDGEWLHFKSVGEYDRSEGGWLLDNGEKDVTYDSNDNYRCHKHNGCQALRFTVDNTNANRQACGPLPTTKRKLFWKLKPFYIQPFCHIYFILILSINLTIDYGSLKNMINKFQQSF